MKLARAVCYGFKKLFEHLADAFEASSASVQRLTPASETNNNKKTSAETKESEIGREANAPSLSFAPVNP